MAQAASVPLLHRFLGIGATVLAIAMVALRSNGLPAGDGDMSFLAYPFAGIGVVLLIVAVLVLAPRVPERLITQSVDAYWMTPAVVQAALRVWFLAEGAAIIATVGYFLTGHLATAATMVVAIGTFWWMGPNFFAKP